MAEQFVRVVLGEGDVEQLRDIDGYVEFAGSVNGAPVPVRFYPADAEAAGDLDPDEMRAALTAREE